MPKAGEAVTARGTGFAAGGAGLGRKGSGSGFDIAGETNADAGFEAGHSGSGSGTKTGAGSDGTSTIVVGALPVKGLVSGPVGAAGTGSNIAGEAPINWALLRPSEVENGSGRTGETVRAISGAGGGANGALLTGGGVPAG